jgi:tryptophan-rich sensory protein
VSEVVRLAVAIVVPEAVGIVGALVTAPAVRSWYGTLSLPEWRPPDWLFGPVWTLLYLLMGIASYLVWREGLAAPVVRAALAAYGVQLALNLAWSFLFFGLRSPLAGLVDLALLWIAVATTTALFFPVRATAGWLMVPYLAWVTFAGALNLAIWRAN